MRLSNNLGNSVALNIYIYCVICHENTFFYKHELSVRSKVLVSMFMNSSFRFHIEAPTFSIKSGGKVGVFDR